MRNQCYNLWPAKRRALLGLYQEHSAAAVLTGHAHKTILLECQGVPLVTGGNTNKNFNKRSLGFRLWTAEGPKSLKHEFVPLEAVAKTGPSAKANQSCNRVVGG